MGSSRTPRHTRRPWPPSAAACRRRARRRRRRRRGRAEPRCGRGPPRCRSRRAARPRGWRRLPWRGPYCRKGRNPATTWRWQPALASSVSSGPDGSGRTLPLSPALYKTPGHDAGVRECCSVGSTAGWQWRREDFLIKGCFWRRGRCGGRGRIPIRRGNARSRRDRSYARPHPPRHRRSLPPARRHGRR